MKLVRATSRVRQDLPILAAGLTLLVAHSTPAQAQSDSAGGSVSLEQPVGGSFALISTQGVLSAVFLSSNGVGAATAAASPDPVVQSSIGDNYEPGYGLAGSISHDAVSVGVSDLNSSGSASASAGEATTRVVLAQFN